MAPPKAMPANTSLCQWAWDFMRATPSYIGRIANAHTAGSSRPYSAMKGVTMALMWATSSLGKLLLPAEPNQSLGLLPSRGRARRKASLAASADTLASSIASVAFQKVLPNLESLPSQSAPPTTVTAERLRTTNWFERDQMPLSSSGRMWSMPSGPPPARAPDVQLQAMTRYPTRRTRWIIRNVPSLGPCHQAAPGGGQHHDTEGDAVPGERCEAVRGDVAQQPAHAQPGADEG